jgi:hypothetical protein
VNYREQAWDTIHERLPAGWRTAPPTYDPATRLWSVTALGPKLGGRHGKPPDTVTGEGPDELAALRDLTERLAGSTLDTVSTSLPVPLGTKGTRSFPPAASWAVDWAAYAHGPSGNVPTTATGAAYYVGCHQYWGTAGGDTFAAYPAAVIQVQKG